MSDGAGGSDPADLVGDKTPTLGHGVLSKEIAAPAALDEASSPAVAADGAARGGAGGAGGAVVPADSAETEEEKVETRAAQEEMLSALKRPEFDELMSFSRKKGAARGGAGGASAESKVHHFWSTQPVVQEGAAVKENGPLEADKPVSEVKQDPYGLVPGFEWCTISVDDSAQLEEFYNLLANNYVEDDDCMFRFNYSVEFLKWALTPPGYYPDWIVGVRSAKSKKLMASITGVPADISVHGEHKRMCEINFLCVDKRLRSKRVAPVLIKEVTRRVNLRGIFQAAYTAGVVLPRPVTSCLYWHRNIDTKKLVEVQFSALPPRMTMTRSQRLYKLPDSTRTPGLRPLTPADIPSACRQLNAYLSRFKLYPTFNEADFGHWFMPRPGVIDTFVVEKPGGSGEVTDMFSFYHLPSTIVHTTKHKMLNAAYLYYYFANGTKLEALLEDALICARDRGIDVFNCLDIMDNTDVLKALKFGQGDGHLQYYLFNWACPQMEPGQVGLVLM